MKPRMSANRTAAWTSSPIGRGRARRPTAERPADRPRAAATEAGADVGELGVVVVEDQAAHRDVRGELRLARQAELRWEAETLGDDALLGRAFGAGVQSLHDDHAARRARRVTAAGVGERHPRPQRSSEHRVPRRALDEPLVREDVCVRH